MILLLKKYVDACTSTDGLIVENHVDSCTSTDDVHTNENESCTNEACTNDDDEGEDEDDDDDDEEEDDGDDDSNDNINDNNDNNNNDDSDDNDDDNSDNDKLCNFSDKVLNNLVIVSKIKNKFSINIEKIIALINKAGNIAKDDLGLKLDEYKKLNILADELIILIWVLMYGEDRVDNEINNIDVDKEKDANGYVHKFINIVNDKISLLNDVSESIDDLMGGIDVNTSNDNTLKKLKDFRSHIAKLINRFNNTKIILKRKILKIPPNQILKMTSNGILMILGNL